MYKELDLLQTSPKDRDSTSQWNVQGGRQELHLRKIGELMSNWIKLSQSPFNSKI